MTKILALDGATRTCGVALLQSGTGLVKLSWCGNLKLDEEMSIPARLDDFSKQFDDLIARHTPDYIAIEDLKFNAGAPNFGSLTKVAMVIGVACQVAYRRLGKDPILITASTVRGIIMNTAKKNKKAETRRIINGRFKDDLNLIGVKNLTSKQEDISDAIALGWSAFSKLKDKP